MPDDEGLREELRAVLAPHTPYADSLTRALLPVVERYAARRAAEALREAATTIDRSLYPPTHVPSIWRVVDQLRARADALAAEEAGRG